MMPAKRAPRRTLREFVRRLFAYRMLFSAAILAGIGAGVFHAWSQAKSFSGFMELAAQTTAGPAQVRLPDAVQLRRLLLEPRVVRTLLPESAESADVDELPGLVEMQRAIEVVPVPAAVGADRSVFRINVEVPANDWRAARKRLRDYAEKLQFEFENTAVVMHRPPADRVIPVDASVLTVGYVVWDDPAQGPNATAGISSSNAQAQLKKVQQEIERRRTASAAADRELTAVLEQLRQLDTDGIEAKTQAALLAAHPQWADAKAKLEEANRRLINLANRLTPSHPNYAAAKRQVDQAANGVAKAQNQVIEKLKADAAALQETLATERAAVKTLESKAAALKRAAEDVAAAESKTGSKSDVVSGAAKGTSAPVPASTGAKPMVVEKSGPAQSTPHTTSGLPGLPVEIREPESTAIGPKPTPPASLRPESTPPSVVPPVLAPPEPRKLDSVTPLAPATRPGKILVAGPFVDRQPIRPRWWHDTLYGALVGTLLGLALVTFRGSVDQRVHSPVDIDQLSLGVEVFGSIPLVESGPPVRISRGSTFGN